jgi:Fur family iron response transcriptional regulator
MRKTYTTQEIEKKLSEAGVQPSLQRIAISHYVLCSADHPTAEDVLSWAVKKLMKISQATVYNTLNMLVQAGLARPFRFPHSEKVVYDSNLEDHCHFIDEKSGQVFDVDFDDIKLKIELPKKFKINSLDLVLKGEIKS